MYINVAAWYSQVIWQHGYNVFRHKLFTNHLVATGQAQIFPTLSTCRITRMHLIYLSPTVAPYRYFNVKQPGRHRPAAIFVEIFTLAMYNDFIYFEGTRMRCCLWIARCLHAVYFNTGAALELSWRTRERPRLMSCSGSQIRPQMA